MSFNIGDILIGVAVVAALMLAIYKMSKYQENHCDGDCSRCTHSGEYDCAKKLKANDQPTSATPTDKNEN